MAPVNKKPRGLEPIEGFSKSWSQKCNNGDDSDEDDIWATVMANEADISSHKSNYSSSMLDGSSGSDDNVVAASLMAVYGEQEFHKNVWDMSNDDMDRFLLGVPDWTIELPWVKGESISNTFDVQVEGACSLEYYSYSHQKQDTSSVLNLNLNPKEKQHRDRDGGGDGDGDNVLRVRSRMGKPPLPRRQISNTMGRRAEKVNTKSNPKSIYQQISNEGAVLALEAQVKTTSKKI